jgi:dihydrofolate reductase
MRKVIAGINMSLDGFCDHTALNADDEIHEHYNELLKTAGTLVYGRTTYQLMESFWPTVVKKPTGNKPIDDFAILIDAIPKLVFSNTLTDAGLNWRNVKLARKDLKTEISELRQSGEAKDILIGSRSLIVAAMNLNLADEYQISIQPMVLGKGLELFKNISQRMDLKLIRTKTFGCGAVTHYYAPAK